VYKKAPDYTREGGSIPVTLTFAEALGVNVLLLPMGRGDDGAQYVSSLPQQGLLSRFTVLETVRRMKSWTHRTLLKEYAVLPLMFLFRSV